MVKMAYEMRHRMQKDLDGIKLRISELENTLREMENHNSLEYRNKLRDLEQYYRRKGELKGALKIMGQYGR